MRLRKRTKNTLNKHSCGKFLPQLLQSEHNAVKMMKFCLFVFTERTWNSFCGNNVVPSLLTQFITLIKENNSKRNKTGQNESISRHKKKENPATPRFHTCPWSCTHICRPCTFSDFFFFSARVVLAIPFQLDTARQRTMRMIVTRKTRGGETLLQRWSSIPDRFWP